MAEMKEPRGKPRGSGSRNSLQRVNDQLRWEESLNSSCIPERFQDRTLKSFKAETPKQAHALAFATAYADGFDDVLKTGRCAMFVGLPGTGKTHAAAGLGQELVRRGYRVLFTRTTDLVQHLQAARQALTLAHEITRLDRFDLLILDDLSYVRKDQAETSVLFELIAARYERRSIMITANQPFSGWDSVFPDKAMTVAAIDRLVHHATILEMNVESFRRRAAMRAATSISDTEKED